MANPKERRAFARIARDYERRQAFITAAIGELADRKATLDQIKAREGWEDLEPMERGSLVTLSKAVLAYNKNLVNLVTARDQRSLNRIRAECDQLMRRWIERAGGKTALRFYNQILSAGNLMIWETEAAMGLTFLQDYQYKLIQDCRRQLVDLARNFEAEHPEPAPESARLAGRPAARAVTAKRENQEASHV